MQERLLGEDGHPRKVHEGEDPHRMGLVLEWVYGTIVSTAEKARDGAKRALGKHCWSRYNVENGLTKRGCTRKACVLLHCHTSTLQVLRDEMLGPCTVADT